MMKGKVYARPVKVKQTGQVVCWQNVGGTWFWGVVRYLMEERCTIELRGEKENWVTIHRKFLNTLVVLVPHWLGHYPVDQEQIPMIINNTLQAYQFSKMLEFEVIDPNQCDGCKAGLPLIDGIHKDHQLFGIGCTKDRYPEFARLKL